MGKLVSILLTCSAIASAQTQQIKAGSTVYIEPMNGYETYLAAALVKKHVPLLVVMDKTKADFIITSAISRTVPSQPAVVVNNSNTNVAAVDSNVDTGSNGSFGQGFNYGAQAAARRAALGETSASISIVDPHSSQVAFAYSAAKGGSGQLRNTAEDCAKHIKEFIEKPEKHKK